jgi:3-oxoacid CoA-transferase B subunit
MVKGMGGSMDLVAGVKKVVIIMDHNARDGSAKFLKQCTLPLTGVGVVDMIISDVGVFIIDESGATLIELAPDVTVEEVQNRTEASFKVAKGLS